MPTRNNILLLCTDHWPASLLGCAGHRSIMTPTIDTLAEGGIRFTNCYSECPVCIPARRSLMTGLPPRGHGDRIYNEHLPMPPVQTLAGAFRAAGYQTYAVGKLHVYPQRDRIGFDDVLLQEEGRYEFGVVDDYQLWLGEQGYAGQEFLHGMGNNSYLTRPWHLPEQAHPTVWATRQMIRQIKRKDPTRPAFYFLSYQFPHPPLVPLPDYWEMYAGLTPPTPLLGDWERDGPPRAGESKRYSDQERVRAIRAFYAQCTLIDHQIRLLIGTLREEGLLEHTVIAFLSDHGDMLFDHGMVAKRCFYQGAANIPLILSGPPVRSLHGTVDPRLSCLEDVMPTLLELCGVPVPASVEGVSLLSDEKRALLYGEVGEGVCASRMLRDSRYKLIYYPCGNLFHLFDLERDPDELSDLSGNADFAEVRTRLEAALVERLYGSDLAWIAEGRLAGLPTSDSKKPVDYGLYNQRGGHWPPPRGYQSRGNNEP